jgi:WD40 repeat protein
MAHAFQMVRNELPLDQRHGTFARYIGATPSSFVSQALLGSIHEEIAVWCGGDVHHVPLVGKDGGQTLLGSLSMASKDRPLFVFIDGVEMLKGGDDIQRLAWLPIVLPPYAKLIVTVKEEHAAAKDDENGLSQCFSVLQKRIPSESLLPLLPLEPEQAVRLIQTWLSASGRRLQSRQWVRVQEAAETNGLPLYLRLIFEEASRWKSYSPSLGDARHLPTDIEGLIVNFLSRLEQPQHHRRLLVERAVSYLISSRRGLSEEELLHLLSSDGEVIADFIHHSPTESKKSSDQQIRELPFLVWSRLRADLERYMADSSVSGGTVITFYHHQVVETLRNRYLDDERSYHFHRTLARLFQSQPARFPSDHQNHQSLRCHGLPNFRKLDELPWHLLHLAILKDPRSLDAHRREWDEIADCLTEWEFVEVKANADADSVFELADDFRQTVRAMSPEHQFYSTLDAIGRTLHNESEILRDNLLQYPELLFETFWNDGVRYEKLNSKSAKGERRDSNYRFVLEKWRSEFEANSQNRGWLCLLPQGVPPQRMPVRLTLGHSKFINALAFDADSRICISGSDERLLTIWDLEHNRRIRDLVGHHAGVTSVAMTPDGLSAVSVSSDLSVRFWDIPTGQLICLKEVEGATPDQVVITPDGKTAITSSRHERGIRIWHIDDRPDRMYDLGRPECIVLDPLGRRAAFSARSAVSIFDLTSMEVRHIASVHCKALSFSRDGQRLFCANGNQIYVYDSDSWTISTKFDVSGDEVYFLKALPDGRVLIACTDMICEVWDPGCSEVVESARAKGRIVGAGRMQSGIQLIQRDPAGGLLVSTLEREGSDNGGREADSTEQVHDGGTVSVSLSQDGRIGIVARHGGLAVWDLRLVLPRKTIPCDSEIRAVALSSGGTSGCAVSSDGVLHTFDANLGMMTGQFFLGKPETDLRALDGPFIVHHDGLLCLALSERGDIAAIGTEDRRVILFDLAVGREICSLADHQYPVSSLAFDNTGEKLVSGSANVLRIYRAPFRSLWREVRTQATISSLAFASNAQVILLATGNAIDVLSAEDCKKITTLRGHKGRITGVSIDPTGKLAVSCSTDQTLRVWDLTNMSCTGICTTRMELSSCACASKGERIIVGGMDGETVFMEYLARGAP